MTKVLAQFLEEQQEPFALDLYLLERGYCHSNATRNPNASSTFCYSAQIFTRSVLKTKTRYAIPNCSRFVKAVFSRLVFDNNIQGRITTFSDDKFSSGSSTNVFGSCEENNTDCLEVDILSPEKEIDADRKLKWTSIEDYNSEKQLSPVSVLEETDQGSPLHYKKYNPKRRKRETWSSTSECKLEQPNKLEDSKPYDQYMINKRALQQTKQLLIDCVREVIENHGSKRDKNRQEELNKILGADELWKLVCENVWLWSQDSIHETNIQHILYYDYLDSVQTWTNDFKQQNEAMSMDIGDAILEDIIYEIVKVII